MQNIDYVNRPRRIKRDNSSLKFFGLMLLIAIVGSLN